MKKFTDIIIESLNAFSDITWDNVGKNLIGCFSINDAEYRIKIEYIEDLKSFVPDLSPHSKVFVVKFARKDENGEYVMSLFNDSNQPLRVFATLRKAIGDFLDNENPHILFFVGDEERASLYSKLLGLAELTYTESYTMRKLEHDKSLLYFLIKLSYTQEIDKIEQSPRIWDLLK